MKRLFIVLTLTLLAGMASDPDAPDFAVRIVWPPDGSVVSGNIRVIAIVVRTPMPPVGLRVIQ